MHTSTTKWFTFTPSTLSLQKPLKTYLWVPKPTKHHWHCHSHIHQPKNLVYLESPTLSVMDINHNLEFLYQNWRIPSSYDMPFGGPPLLWGQAPLFSHQSGLGTPGGLPGLERPMGIGLGPSLGFLPSAQNLVVGLHITAKPPSIQAIFRAFLLWK
jgi:hypothetical protein